MRINKTPFAVIVALCLVICMMVPAFAAGTGTREDPIVCETVADLPATATVPAGDYLFFVAPIGGMALTVTDNTTAVNVVGPLYQTLAYTSDGMGVAVVSFTVGYMEGDQVLFGLFNQNPYADTVVELSVGEPLVAEVGTYENPEDANARYNEYTQSYLMNTDLAAGDFDGYWYTFTAEEAGVLCVENSAVDANGSATTGYQLIVEKGYTQSLAHDGIYSNPVTTYRLAAGETVKIGMYAEADQNGNYPQIKVYANLVMVEGNEEDPVSVKSAGFKSYIASGDTVYFIDGTKDGAYCTGLVISGYSDAIAVTTVTVNGVEYTDVNGDGTIGLMLTDNSYYNRALFSITNDHEWDISYTVTLVESADENFYEAGTGHILEHHEAVEPVCHMNGMQEYWYCAECDNYYTDGQGTQNIARLSLVIPAEITLEHHEAVEVGCHTNGMQEYWYCAGCDCYFTDAEGKYNTARLNLVIPCENTLEHHETVDPICHMNGMQEYWYCAGCDCYFTDAEGKYNIARLSLVIPAEVTLEHHEAVEVGCHTNGMQEYWYCAGCDCYFTDAEGKYNTARLSLVIPCENTLEHSEKVPATCVNNGMQEYWYCAGCDCYFTDAEGKYNIARLSLVIPADGVSHVLEHHEAVAATCVNNGMQEYWYCAECDCYFTDAEGKYNIARLSLVIPADGVSHVLEHHEAVAPTCVENGMQEYWYCAECDCYFTDAEGKYNIARLSLVIPADGTDHVLEHHDAVEVNCHWNGMQEYWYCAECDCYFTDAEGKFNIARLSLVIPCENTLEHSEKVPATCVNNGMQEYWYCAGCDCYFTDAEGKYNIARLSLVIPANGMGHVMDHHETVEPGCHQNGMQEYWYCSECDCFFTDCEGKYNIASKRLVILAPNALEHHEAVAPTATENGMMEYWYCAECDCYFTDAEGKYNIARLSLVIPATGEPEEQPGTGDYIVIFFAIASIAVVGMAAVVMGKKKFFA